MQSYESLAKKAARYCIWRALYADLGCERFRASRFMYLAGPDGGDASVLAGLGVAADRQLAVDSDRAALASFCERFPEVPTFCGGVDEVDSAFDVAFVDLTVTLDSPQLVGWLDGAAQSLSRHGGAWVVYAVSYGREQLGWSPIGYWAGDYEGAGLSVSAARRWARFDLAQAYMSVVLRGRRMLPTGWFFLTYTGLRMPMLACGVRVARAAAKWSAEKYDRRFATATRAAPLWVSRLAAPRDPYELLETVECDGLGDPALLMNVTRSTVAAYRAVRTRRDKEVVLS